MLVEKLERWRETSVELVVFESKFSKFLVDSSFDVMFHHNWTDLTVSFSYQNFIYLFSNPQRLLQGNGLANFENNFLFQIELKPLKYIKKELSVQAACYVTSMFHKPYQSTTCVPLIALS